MEYLQYFMLKPIVDVEVIAVLNLVISGIPSILSVSTGIVTEVVKF